MSVTRTILTSFIVCIAVCACAIQSQQKEGTDAPAASTIKPASQSISANKSPASGAVTPRTSRNSQSAAPAKSTAKSDIADSYPLSPNGKKCPDYAQASIIKTKLSRESSDGYLFDAKFRLTGHVEEIAAWGYNLNATRLKVGDKVCIEPGHK